MGQQRKLKELLNWLKKKKRRTIRKDELISFLIGKQFGANSMPTSMASSSSFAATSTTTSVFSNPTSNFLANGFQQQQQTQQQQQQQQGLAQMGQGQLLFPKQQVPFTTRQQPTLAPQSQFQFGQQQPNQLLLPPSSNNNNRNTFNSNLNNPTSNNIINGDTSSDLATFREALIMHSN
jgi:hypothetical protein